MTASPPPSQLRLSIENRIEALGAKLDAVEAFLGAWAVDPGDCAQVMIILDEIASNIIRSAWPGGSRHRFEVDLHIVPHAAALSLVLVAVDDGMAFDPTARPAPDTTSDLDAREPGGLGLFLVQEMSDSIEYRRIDGFNRLQVAKQLQRVEQPA